METKRPGYSIPCHPEFRQSGFGCRTPGTQIMLDIVANIVFGAGAVIGIWLPVYAYQCAVKSIHSAGPDE